MGMEEPLLFFTFGKEKVCLSPPLWLLPFPSLLLPFFPLRGKREKEGKGARGEEAYPSLRERSKGKAFGPGKRKKKCSIKPKST